VAAEAVEVLARDSEVGPVEAQAGRGVERARAGAGALVRAEVCGKRGRLRVEAEE